MEFGRESPMKLSTYKWYRFFIQGGCMFYGKRHDKELVTAAKMSELQVAIVQNPRNQQHKFPTVQHTNVNSAQN
jgi:hypothetical protein